MVDSKTLASLVKKHGLQKAAKKIRSAARSSICISAKKADEDKMPLGRSKIGGRPDLPSKFKWPKWKDEPMLFLAQLNLKEFAKYDVEGLLPKEGLLLFFYDSTDSVFGFDPKDKGGWSVTYIDDKDPKLTRTAPPKEPVSYHQFPACELKFRVELTLPEWYSQAAQHAGITKDERERYCEVSGKLWEARQKQGRRLHQVLGHPFQIQTDMALESQMVSNGVYMGDGNGMSDPRFEKLFDGAVDWRLLFQLDSDPECNMGWSDSGMLYFWIREEDLKKKAFDKCWFVLQCY